MEGQEYDLQSSCYGDVDVYSQSDDRREASYGVVLDESSSDEEGKQKGEGKSVYRNAGTEGEECEKQRGKEKGGKL